MNKFDHVAKPLMQAPAAIEVTECNQEIVLEGDTVTVRFLREEQLVGLIKAPVRGYGTDVEGLAIYRGDFGL